MQRDTEDRHNKATLLLTANLRRLRKHLESRVLARHAEVQHYKATPLLTAYIHRFSQTL